MKTGKIEKVLILFIGFILPIQIFAQTEMWVARYNGSVSVPGAYDAAYAMVVDDSGYIYVTGESCDTAWSDYMTIKYNSSGDTVWVRKYNGPDNLDDAAYAIAVDKSGNVYVTGASVGNGTYYDYATVKYNSAGDEMWVRRYNYSSSGYNGDGAHAIAVDDSGDVYVTGESCSGTNYDYATIKYDSLGDTMWVRRYNGPIAQDDRAYAISMDNNGSIYVTGISGDSVGFSYTTIKYNNSGDTVWVRRYGETGKGHEGPKGYDFDNTKGFAHGGGGASIAINTTKNVNFKGCSWKGRGPNFYNATIKKNSSGDTMWIRRYHGPDSTGWNEATALALDSNGNVYVTGKSYSSATYYDYATIKYNSSGDTMWVRRYNGTGDSTDCARGIAVDNDGNVYVTGNSWGVGSVYGEDYATIKYNSLGSEEWVQRYNGPGNRTDDAYSIAVDNNGYVYVTGKSAGGGYDYVTIKYSTVGAEEEKLNIKNQKSNIKIFPNPFVSKTVVSGSASGEFRSAQQKKETKIQIYDISGKLVETTKDNVIGKNLKSGIYFVKIGEYKPMKVVKMGGIK
ncbi:MAG: SBBP repeat-containing protein [bacterium]|nr:SBBP repeat-containing protein [bacterium]